MKNIQHTIRRVCLALALATTVVAPTFAQEAAAGVSTEARIDLNTASEAELTSLPGIGPSKAEAIIAFRDRRRFRRIEELMRVRGIGRATFRRIRERLNVSR